MQLGDRMRSVVSGYEGIAVAKVEFLNGCVRYQLQPGVDKDGKLPDGDWLDVQELVVVESQAVSLPKPQQPAESPDLAGSLRGGGANPTARRMP